MEEAEKEELEQIISSHLSNLFFVLSKAGDLKGKKAKEEGEKILRKHIKTHRH